MKKKLKLVALLPEEEQALAAAAVAVAAVCERFQQKNRGTDLTAEINFQRRLDLEGDGVNWVSSARWMLKAEGGQGLGIGKTFEEALFRTCVGSYPHEKLETAKKYREAADRLEREARKGGAR